MRCGNNSNRMVPQYRYHLLRCVGVCVCVCVLYLQHGCSLLATLQPYTQGRSVTRGCTQHCRPSLCMLQSLVETAMLAAVSGLAFTLATLLSLESYLGYFLPMPVIVAAMRSGPAAGRKTMTATCFLLLCKPRLKVACGNSMHITLQTASAY